MSQVTSGLVSIEDGIKKAEEYAPPRKVRVELSFGVGEGEDYQSIFDTVSQAATNRVHALLNGTALAAVSAAPVVQTATPAADPSAVVEEPAAAEAPKTRTRRTKEQIAADNAAAAAAKADPASVEDPTGGQPAVIHLPDASAPANQPANKPATSADPAAIEDDLTSSGPVASDPAAVGDDLTSSPPAEISDAELNSAVQKKNQEINNPPAIRALIGTFNPDPTKVFQLAQIPQAQRADFLAKLAALKAAAA